MINTTVFCTLVFLTTVITKSERNESVAQTTTAPHERGRQSPSLQKLHHLHTATFPDKKCKDVEKRLKFYKSELFVNPFPHQRQALKRKVNSVRKEYSKTIKTQIMKMLQVN